MATPNPIERTLDTQGDLDIHTDAVHQGRLFQIGAYTAHLTQDCEGRFQSDWHYLQMSLAEGDPIFSQFVPQATSQWHRNGRCVFVPAGQTVDCRIRAGSRRTLSCLFDPHLLRGDQGRDIAWDRVQPDRAADVKSLCLQLVFQRILDELLCPSFEGDFYIESAINFLGAEIVRCLDPGRDEQQRSGTLTTRQMALLRDRIESIGERPPTLSELAELVSLSPGVLSDRFQRSTTRTLRAYVAETKMEKAKAFLMRGDLMMKQIAFMSGFESAAAFATAFRRQFGLTPSQFRSRLLH